MKTLFTSVLLMTMLTLQAMPVFNDSTNPGKKKEVTSISNPSNPSAVSVQQLQDENALLRAKVATLENAFENEKGILNYRLTMQVLFNKLDEHQRIEKMNDLRAEINYQQAMANALLLLKNQSEQ